MLIIPGGRPRLECEKVSDEPITYFIDGIGGTHLEISLELGSRLPSVAHRISISDGVHVQYDLRFFSEEPESLLQTILDALVNEVVPSTRLHEFVFMFGGTSLTLPNPATPTPPKSILN